MSTDSDFYSFTVKDADLNDVSMADYKGKVVMIVNVASRCGFTKQYDEIQEVYNKYKDQGFEVLAFPCNQFGSQEPGTNEEICTFARTKFKVTFKIFDKINVNGSETIPLYNFLKKEGAGFLVDAVKWNFTKFLVSKSGKVLKRYAPNTSPKDMEDDIQKLLKE
ncbi:predicted protein [Naegleria gruberi]|uniref:Glutathione peroxidase n=1 Tax=Naegleria gruberi TaxID=5762 RepID=D2V639_NAEGR|nr:uncharacterized protein NAEGRDRAFT_35731 [Naegleria gruberi]EFC47763.1 predicted protein [Naegleria gruberi]|eukprot:XP_002680507.1 predicted protein [Naegleria gruberi strain NEG-M]